LVPPTVEGGAYSAIEKPKLEWSSEDRKKHNLDRVAKDILFKSVGKNMFQRVKMCLTAKDILDKIVQLNEGNELIRENKLLVANQKFEQIK
ncbi:hypothetical protein, partial [Serratia marcescens]|uniref:hypothetical protein n=1 Tax=Serratia marcescens TaxID=615 RepID=UPI00281427CA